MAKLTEPEKAPLIPAVPKDDQPMAEFPGSLELPNDCEEYRLYQAILDVTKAYQFPLPNLENMLDVDIWCIRMSIIGIDAVIAHIYSILKSSHGGMGSLQGLGNSVAALRVDALSALNQVEQIQADLAFDVKTGDVEIQRDAQGQLTGAITQIDGKPKVMTLARGTSGQVESMTTTYDGRTRVQTLRMLDGVVMGITTTETTTGDGA